MCAQVHLDGAGGKQGRGSLGRCLASEMCIRDRDCPVAVVTEAVTDYPQKVALSTSLGFGGHNAALAFSPYKMCIRDRRRGVLVRAASWRTKAAPAMMRSAVESP